MHSAIRHHHVLHAASPTAAANHPASLNTLTPWLHSPLFLTFAPCFVVMVLLMIRHRINLHRRGERFTPRKTKPAEMVGALLFGAALMYFSKTVPAIGAIVEWPYHIPCFRDHHLEMWAGVLAASLVARIVSALYAASFLRSTGSRGGGDGLGVAAARHTLLPTAPPGYDWYSQPQTRQRITRQRTYHIEEE